MKKLLAILLTASMAVTALTGCGSAAEQAASVPETGTQAAAAEEKQNTATEKQNTAAGNDAITF